MGLEVLWLPVPRGTPFPQGSPGRPVQPPGPGSSLTPPPSLPPSLALLAAQTGSALDGRKSAHPPESEQEKINTVK